MAPKKSRSGSRKAKRSKQEQELHTATLEVAYAESNGAVAAAIADEDARRMHVDMEVSKNDNDVLAAEVERLQHMVEWLDQEHDETLSTITVLDGMVHEKDANAKLLEEEIERGRSRIKKLEESTSNNESLVDENLELSRKLKSATTEVEHLRKVVEENEQVLSAKLMLETEVRKLKVEIEAMRKAAEEPDENSKLVGQLQKKLKAAQKEIEAFKSEAAESAATGSKIKALEAELERERRQRESAEQELARHRKDWEAQRSIQTDKLGTYKVRLRAVKEELQVAQELLEAERTKTQASATSTAVGARRGTPVKNILTSFQLENQELAIGTPGDGPGRRMRKPLVGTVADKSTFSTTPFLDRSRRNLLTSSLMSSVGAPSSAHEKGVGGSQKSAKGVHVSGLVGGDDEDPDDSLVGAIMAADVSRVGQSSVMTSLLGGDASEGRVEEEKKAVEEPRAVKGRAAKNGKGKAASAATEAVPEAETPAPEPAAPKTKAKVTRTKKATTGSELGPVSSSILNSSVEAGVPKRKRRLGAAARTLFDEDEDELAAGLKAAGLKGAKKTGVSTTAKRKKAVAAMEADGFEFSPLKRRR